MSLSYVRIEISKRIPLHPYHNAYQISKSPEAALIKLTDWILDARMRKETIVFAFLCIEGAFGNTSHNATKALINKYVM